MAALGKKYNWSVNQVVKIQHEGGRAPAGWSRTTPWDLYEASFNGVDLYNKDLNRFKWPFKHVGRHGHGADADIAEFIEAITLQNSYHAWLNVNPEKNNMSYYYFLIELADELYMRALYYVI